MVYVLTVDQQRSRRGRDLVDDALAMLATELPEPLLPFERTAGDEFQGVLSEAIHVVHAAIALVRNESWSVGIGAGAAEQPLPGSTRSARGPAFVYARDALDAAKQRPQRLAVVGAHPTRTTEADALLTLLAALISRRTEAGWEAVDLVESGCTLTEAAERLDITRQAIGQRLAVALWQQQKDVHPLAARLLEESQQAPSAS